MALITCPDCSTEISDAAVSCPRCGRPNQRIPPPSAGWVTPPIKPTTPVNTEQKRSIGVLLGIGILLFPIIFSWFTLRKGYGVIERVVAFVWLVIFVYAIQMSDSPTTNNAAQAPTPSSTPQPAPKPVEPRYATSNATYNEVNSQVGCDSKYSDDKKDDIFKANYKDHWMTWKGVVVLAEADNVSLNIDGVGTQDLQVDFADERAGYDLTKGNKITVKFLMKTSGGCFLPFGGDDAVIVN